MMSENEDNSQLSFDYKFKIEAKESDILPPTIIKKTEQKDPVNVELIQQIKELNASANEISNIISTQNQEEARLEVIKSLSNVFIQSRISNSIKAENVKNKLLEIVLSRAETLDNITLSQLLSVIDSISATDFNKVAKSADPDLTNFYINNSQSNSNNKIESNTQNNQIEALNLNKMNNILEAFNLIKDESAKLINESKKELDSNE